MLDSNDSFNSLTILKGYEIRPKRKVKSKATRQIKVKRIDKCKRSPPVVFEISSTYTLFTAYHTLISNRLFLLYAD